MAKIKQSGFLVTITGFVELPKGDLAAFSRASLMLDAAVKSGRITPELMTELKIDDIDAAPKIRRVEEADAPAEPEGEPEADEEDEGDGKPIPQTRRSKAA